MSYHPERPLIVQGDHSLLLETHNRYFSDARDAIAPFAELEKSPEHIHTYRLHPLSLWNAAAAGYTLEQAEAALHRFSKYAIPANVLEEMRSSFARYGQLVLSKDDEQTLRLTVHDPYIAARIVHEKSVVAHIRQQLADHLFLVDPDQRGPLKHALIKLGFPVDDQAGFHDAPVFHITLRKQTLSSNQPLALRDYQQSAVDAFVAGGSHGVVVLACGAGKTLVGMAAMARIGMQTLIITPNTAAAHQWRAELLDKTEVSEAQLGEYTGNRKEILPITIATYQMLSWRPERDGDMPHMELITKHAWGLIIFDEVHVLPAPVFRALSAIQARRRLGLTATLIREDGLERDVFSLIGPKRYDLPWRQLEASGHIAKAHCIEIRVAMSPDDHFAHAVAEDRRKAYRIAAENSIKVEVTQALVVKHAGDGILVIGQYLEQLQRIAEHLGAPLISGRMSSGERERLYAAFRSGELNLLVVSRVANYAIDLPGASVAIQVSGSFGSRQEEAQRLGRILRPKSGPAFFYTLVSNDSEELKFAINRQRFLAEQGYDYLIEAWK
ncbi:helicase [Mariprofundus erugo]|uniref:DNA repair helicase XPB n=1 Tax=Mariprofundus erugo TaxID=2528639 RepID=UPI0010FEBD7C|nr:DNA repair helicase XPB [Mariprofundus erugo]TLS76009.1 helicase [Mariprofundus erugo]